MECSHNEIDPNIVIPSYADLTNKLSFRGVVENNRRRLNVFCNIIKPPATNDLTVAEDTLTPGHLGVKQLRPDGITFPVPAKRAADRCQQDIWHVDFPRVEEQNESQKTGLLREHQRARPNILRQPSSDPVSVHFTVPSQSRSASHAL